MLERTRPMVFPCGSWKRAIVPTPSMSVARRLTVARAFTARQRVDRRVRSLVAGQDRRPR